MFKKGQGLSINTIIIAIIVLVVLVVLVMIFTGYFGQWTKSVASCQSEGGTCMVAVAGQTCVGPFGNRAVELEGVCETAGDICCPPGSTIGVPTP